jgi:hypothetical protein
MAPLKPALPLRLLALLTVAGSVLATGSAAAQGGEAPPVTYPAALDRESLAAWLRKETDIDPDSVVAVTPDSVVAVLQSRIVEGGVAMIVRGEVLTAQAVARDKVASWHETVQVDCAAGRIRQGVTTGYAARNLLFDGGPIREADKAWSKPLPGDPLDQIRRAACEKDFRGPLTAGAPPPPAKPPTAAAEPQPQPSQKKEPPKLQAPKPAPAAASPLQAAPTAMAPVSVQIAAAGGEDEAAGLLARLKVRQPQAMGGLDTRVVKAQVKGKTVFRALVVGFDGHAAAVKFCQDLKAAKQDCFVRSDLGR